jgi:hypothetical protein
VRPPELHLLGDGIGRVQTIRRAGRWTNELDGRATGRYRTKDEAALAGREIAMAAGAEHVIHNFDGSVTSRTPPSSLTDDEMSQFWHSG